MELNARKKYLYRGISIVLLLGIWQGISASHMFPKTLFPSLMEIGMRLLEEFWSGSLGTQLIYSVWTILICLFISLFITGMLLLLSRAHPFFRECTHLISQIAHPLPGIAILPLVILWFGIGKTALYFVLIHSMLWPLWIQLDTSQMQIYQKYRQVMEAFRFSKKKRIFKVYGYGLIPSATTGVRIAWSRGWRALISVEMVFGVLGPYHGLGWYIFERRMYMDTAGLYAGLFVIALCGVLFETFLFGKMEEQIHGRWRD